MTSTLIDLEVDGTSLQDYATIVETWGAMLGSAPLRGGNFVLPDLDGEEWTAKRRSAQVFSVGVAVLPGDPDTGVDPAGWDALVGQWVDNWRSLLTLVDCSAGPKVLTRTLPSASQGTIVEECTAEIVDAVEPAMLGPYAARAVLTFRNLDGLWVAGS